MNDPATETKAEEVSADAVASPNVHDVNPDAVAAAAARDGVGAKVATNAPATLASGAPPNVLDPKGRPRVDRNGKAFDPAMHEVDASGLAVLRTDGRLQIKKGARGKGTSSQQLPPIDGPAAVPPAGEAPPADGSAPTNAMAQEVVDYQAAAKAIVLPVLGFWKRATDGEYDFDKDERDSYVAVTAVLMEKYGVSGAMPPELLLPVLVASSVYARREKPKTKAMLERLWAWTLKCLGVKKPDEKPAQPGDPQHTGVAVAP